MKKQSQNANSEAIKKAVLKGAALAVTGLTFLAGFTACNKTGQNTQSKNPDPKPPVVDPIDPINPVDPVEKTFTIDKIYNDYFLGTSFAADIQAAQNALANRVFDNLTPQIANITYNEKTKELSFEINYVENGKAKSGSMTFTAPAFFQEIRGKQAKALVLEYAELIANSEVKESEVDGVKAKIEKAIENISSQIATSFAAIKTNNVSVEKEQDPIPVETISFDELIADELGEYLGNIALLKDASINMFKLGMLGYKSIDDDFKIAIEDEKLVYYINGNTTSEKRLVKNIYNGSANDFLDLINIATVPQALLNAYFTNSQQNNMQIELNSEEYHKILNVCQTILTNVNEQTEKLEGLNNNSFTRSALARHNNSLSQDEALQFALKLGYSADEVLGVYVGTSGNRGFDETFGTGYCNSFTLSVLSKDYKLSTCVVYVPHYSDSKQADYYRYFLEGESGKRYELKNETTTNINGIVIDYAKENATAQSSHVKVASYNDYDLFLPERFFN